MAALECAAGGVVGVAGMVRRGERRALGRNDLAGGGGAECDLRGLSDVADDDGASGHLHGGLSLVHLGSDPCSCGDRWLALWLACGTHGYSRGCSLVGL